MSQTTGTGKQRVFSMDDIPISEDEAASIRDRWFNPELTEGPSTYHEYLSPVNQSTIARSGHHHADLVNYQSPRHLFDELSDEVVRELPDNSPKKMRIVALKLVFGSEYGVPSDSIIESGTDCSASYIGQFDYFHSDETVVQRASLSSSKRSEILERDGCCLKCGSEEENIVHHIKPRSEGGESTDENLATLCHECHMDAHSWHRSGTGWKVTFYGSVAEFWAWVEDSGE